MFLHDVNKMEDKVRHPTLHRLRWRRKGKAGLSLRQRLKINQKTKTKDSPPQLKVCCFRISAF